MKTSAKILLITLGAVLIIIVAAIFWMKKQIDSHTIKASGNVVTQTIIPDSFDTIHITGGFSVQLHLNDKYEVKVAVDQNFQKLIDVAVYNRTLKIENRRSFQSVRAKVDITCPSFSVLNLSGGVRFESDDMLTVPHFSMISSAGTIVKLKGTFETFEGTLSAGSELNLTGSAKSSEFNLSAGSFMNGEKFEVDSSYISAVAGSRAEINTTQYLEAEASAGSMIFYIGSPNIGKLNTSAGGSIQKKE